MLPDRRVREVELETHERQDATLPASHICLSTMHLGIFKEEINVPCLTVTRHQHQTAKVRGNLPSEARAAVINLAAASVLPSPRKAACHVPPERGLGVPRGPRVNDVRSASLFPIS